MLIEPFKIVNFISALRPADVVLIGLDCRIKLLENASIVDEKAEFLGIVKAVHTRNCLNQIVMPERLVNVEDCIPWFIKSRNELVNDD